jgi:transmembrane sensor
MSREGQQYSTQAALSAEDEAAELFIQRLYGEWSAENQAALESRLERDSQFAGAWQRVEEGWASLDRLAEAPEIMGWRADAIVEVRGANARRWTRSDRMGSLHSNWKVAAAAAGLLLAVTSWQLSPYGYRPGEYRTGIGEQRIVELDDHSRIAIDAATRLQVRFSDESRTVRLLEGQAQFSVVKDPIRPFKVIAGDRTVVAVGTVFTVEYVDRKMHVATLEGKVAVLGPNVRRAAADSAPDPRPGGVSESRYLVAGEALQLSRDGQTVVTPKADLAAATAWREGKVIFRTEPLHEAVSRMNRYSLLRIEIDDPALAAEQVSGVFEAGDTRGFVDALERYLPITADYSDADTVRLKPR